MQVVLSILSILHFCLLCNSSLFPQVFDCDFEVDLCGWSIESPWEKVDKTFVPSMFSPNSQVLSGDGFFMLAQGRFGTNSTGEIVSPRLEQTDISRSLSFRYSKTTGDVQLKILMKKGSMYHDLDTISAVPAEEWTQCVVVLPPCEVQHQIVFRVSKIRSGFDVIAVDNIALKVIDLKPGAEEERFQPHIRKSFDVSNLRRAPIYSYNRKEPPQCMVIKCRFLSSTCSWSFSNWKLLDRKIVTEGQGDGILSSDPVLLPMNAHFEVNVFASELSSVTISQVSGSEESLIWTQSGIALVGWNKIRLPLRVSSLPSRIVIKTTTRSDSFVAVTDTNIVDEEGRDLACGTNVPAIRPHKSSLIRLTALQKLDSKDSKLAFSRSQSISPPLPSSVVSSVARLLPISQPKLSSAPFASLPIAPSQVSSSHLSAQSRLAEASPLIIRANPVTVQSTTIPTTATRAKKVPSIQELISGVAGQPLLESQLKFLAKKLGFDQLSGEQAAQRLAQVQKFLSGLKQVKVPQGVRPILPINAQTNGKEPFPSEEMALLLPASIFPSSGAINTALTSKLAQMLSPPKGHGDDSKPFSRNNLDFVVQNAFNAYMNQAKP